MEKRQRVSRACDECKSKKKQCSGTHPCTLCTTRSRQCVFSAGLPIPKDSSRASEKPKKRRRISTYGGGPGHPGEITIPNTPPGEDGTTIETAGRLLQDVGGGRLVYVGDSASLSFLQSMRKLVEGSIGASPFTKDSNRHRIVEASISAPVGYRHTYTLPEYDTAQVLAGSFFANVTGLFEIFSQHGFLSKLAETYQNPLNADPQWLCQLNLVFAVGMQMRRDEPDTMSKESIIFNTLGRDRVNRAESFYLAAKHLNDPAYGLEDGEFSAIQSLFLMTIYMLTAAKRNTAFAYLGMAVRLAYTLGIHKEETLSIFSPVEQQIRRNLWQSLYVMDCFLSSSLGRPSAITSDSMAELCSSPVINKSNDTTEPNHAMLIAAVRASQITGEILSRVYDKRKASRSVAYALSLRFSDWMRKLPTNLHWRQIPHHTSQHNLTLQRLHINLIYFHGVLLLTRPFLLYEISSKLQAQPTPSQPGHEQAPRLDQTPEQAFCFHGACVRSAIHTVTATYSTFKAGALPRRDPFVIYWLFSATLVVLANSFCPVYHENDSKAAIHMAFKVLRSCSEVDAQSARYQTILESFNDTIQRSERARDVAGTGTERDIFNVLFGNDGSLLGHDPTFPDTPATQEWPVIQAVLGPDIPVKDPMTEFRMDTPSDSGAWATQMVSTVDEPVHFDGIWWAAGQDNFVFSDLI